MSPAARERWLRLAGSDGAELAIRVVDVARARHLRLSLGRDGPRLSKPCWVPMREAEAFAREKRDWLEAQLGELRQQAQTAPLPLATGTAFAIPLRGTATPVSVVAGTRPRLCAGPDGLQLQLPERAEPERRRMAARAWRSFLDHELRSDVGRLLGIYTSQLGRAPTRLGLRPLRSLWGSLSARGHLSLDLALVLAEPPVLEYVLVHELCHLFEHGHGPRFWSRVHRVLPDYRERQRRLHAVGGEIKNTLAQLVHAPA